jgi:hypothetical protein
MEPTSRRERFDAVPIDADRVAPEDHFSVMVKRLRMVTPRGDPDLARATARQLWTDGGMARIFAAKSPDGTSVALHVAPVPHPHDGVIARISMDSHMNVVCTVLVWDWDMDSSEDEEEERAFYVSNTLCHGMDIHGNAFAVHDRWVEVFQVSLLLELQEPGPSSGVSARVTNAVCSRFGGDLPDGCTRAEQDAYSAFWSEVLLCALDHAKASSGGGGADSIQSTTASMRGACRGLVPIHGGDPLLGVLALAVTSGAIQQAVRAMPSVVGTPLVYRHA